LRSKVDEICLVAIDGLDAKLDAVLRGATSRPLEDMGDGLELRSLGGLACQRAHMRVQTTREHRRAQGCRRLHSPVEEAPCAFGVGGQMDLRGKAERARATETVAIQQGAGMLHVYRAGIEERYLDKIQANPGGARDHTLGTLARPLTRPDKSVGPEGRATIL
jgi:hypothetical protein